MTKKSFVNRKTIPYIMIAPVVVIFLVFMVYPILRCIYLIVQVPVMIGGALLIAVAVEQKFMRGKAFFRTTIFLPSVTALVAYALVFKVLLNGDHGLINYVIEMVGGKGINWFYEEWPARFAVIISITWRTDGGSRY